MSAYFGMTREEWTQLTDDQRTAVREANDALAAIGIEPTGFRVTGPVWQPGDVVLVRHTSGGTPFPFTRQQGDNWGAYDGGYLADVDVARLVRKGKATLILRDGQLTDDGARMAAERLERQIAETPERGRLTFHTDAEHGAYLTGIEFARRALRGETILEAGQ